MNENKLTLKRRIILHLIQMTNSPRAQLKRLALGTVASALSMLAIIFTISLEQPWLFYLLSITTLLSILYAIPGYIGIWMWRMRSTLFRLIGEDE